MTVECPNPAPKTDVDEWSPQSLPAVALSPVATCTLKGLMRKGEWQPDLIVEPRSRAWTHHQVSTVVSEDATGNYNDSGEPQLSPFEPTWKLRASVYRTADAEFGAEEQWQSPVLEMPAYGEALTVGSGKIGSATIKSVGVKGAGGGMLAEADGKWTFSEQSVPSLVKVPVTIGTMTRPITYHVPMPSTAAPYVLVDVEGLASEDHVIVVVRDQNGEVLGKVDNPQTNLPKTACRAVVKFMPPETLKQIIVSVAISRPEVFEFSIKPPEELKKKPKIWE
jgi:hypothetical protein